MKPKKDTDAVLKALARYGREGDAHLAREAVLDARDKMRDAEGIATEVEIEASYPIRSLVVRRVNARLRWPVLTGHEVTVAGFTSHHRSDPRHTVTPWVRIGMGSGTGKRLECSWFHDGTETLSAWCDRMADAWLVLSPGDAKGAAP